MIDTLPTSEDVRAMTAELQKVHGDLRRHRYFFFAVVVLILAVGIVINARQDSQRCQASNEARSEQIALWNRALPFIVNQGHTAAGQKTVATLEQQAHTAFAPKSCSWIP